MKVLAWLGVFGAMLAIMPASVRAQVRPLVLSTPTNQPPSGPEVATGWTASPDLSVTGYYLCWGLSSGQCTNFIDVGNVTNATLAGLSTNVLYFFTVVAYDAAGDQAVPSNEIQYMVTNDTVSAVAPGITTDLTNVSVFAGASLSLQVNVSGSSPLGYQWLFNGAPLAGANSDPLTLSTINIGQGGAYQVIVTNSAGSATSAVAMVTVLAPPTIVADLTSRKVTTGLNVSFQVAAAGTAPLGYQWFQNGSLVPGATQNFLNLSAVGASQAGSYQVVVTNAFGKVSSSATLQVLNASVLLIQSIGAGAYRLTFGGAPNQTYSVQFSTNVTSGWQSVVTGTADPFGIFSCMAFPGQSTGYFRVK